MTDRRLRRLVRDALNRRFAKGQAVPIASFIERFTAKCPDVPAAHVRLMILDILPRLRLRRDAVPQPGGFHE